MNGVMEQWSGGVMGQLVGTVAPRGPVADLVATIAERLPGIEIRRGFDGALGETRPTFGGSKRDIPLRQHSITPLRRRAPAFGRRRLRHGTRGRFQGGSKTNDNLDQDN